ncbi:MAG: alpha/beta hydrolase fold domain-containing protein [Acidimicrobiales bacterium]
MNRSYGPTRQLLTATRHALLAANARKPLSSSVKASSPVFMLGWPVSELPLIALAANSLAVTRMLRHGALRSRSGRLSLAAEAVTAANLADLHRTARASEAVFEEALVDGLGEGYRRFIGDAGLAFDETPFSRRQTIVPAWISHRKYIEAGDVAYGPAGKRNSLDIWRRPDLTSKGSAPVLLQVHGGAWVMGSKRQQAYPLMSHLTDAGWVCVAINYRLSPKASWPDHIVDVKRAIAWVREHIADHGGDPDFIAITGGSAGGHLSSLAALTPNHAPWQPGFEHADTTVQAAVPMYGVYDFLDWDGQGGPAETIKFLADKVLKVAPEVDPQLWKDASPISWANPDAPPMMIVHGVNDSLAPVDMARRMSDTLRAASGSPVVYAELPRTQHAFDVYSSLRTLYTVRAVERFLAFVRARALGAPVVDSAGPTVDERSSENEASRQPA